MLSKCYRLLYMAATTSEDDLVKTYMDLCDVVTSLFDTNLISREELEETISGIKSAYCNYYDQYYTSKCDKSEFISEFLAQND